MPPPFEEMLLWPITDRFRVTDSENRIYTIIERSWPKPGFYVLRTFDDDSPVNPNREDETEFTIVDSQISLTKI